jgi:hypothetical protein
MNILSIILISIGGLVLLFIIFLIIYKIKKNKDQSSLFGEGFLQKISLGLSKINLPILSEKKYEEKHRVGKTRSRRKGFFRGMIRTLEKNNSVKKERKNNGNKKRKEKIEENKKLKELGKKIEDNKKNDEEDDEERKKRLKERVDVNAKDFDKVVKNIDDSNLAEVVKIFDKRKLIKFNDKDIILETKKDVEEFVKQKIFEYLENKQNMLYEKISELRKKGADTKDIEFQLMSLPLKIKVFKATLKNKDSDKILEMIKIIDKQIKNLEKEFEPENYESENNKNEKGNSEDRE